MTEEIKTIIIDSGSGMTKAGFSGEKTPRKIFPTVIGRPKKEVYVGSESLADIFSLDIDYPIQHGIVTNWENMELIFNHTFFNELRSDPSESTVFLTESSMNPDSNREKLIQLMFETYNVQSFYSCNQAALSLYTSSELSKRNSGIVIEIGYGVCQIVPILDSRPITDAIVCNNLAGCDLNERLKQLLFKKNYTFNTNSELDQLNNIKEKLCYVALDYESELQKAKTSPEISASYKIGEEKEIIITEERFSCPELLFKPFINGYEFAGIDKSLFVAINKVHPAHIKDMYSNIVLSGGSSMFKGFPERIENEISKLAPPTMKVHVVASNDKKYGAWVGASRIAALENFNELVITKKEYKDEGPAVFQRKCY